MLNGGLQTRYVLHAFISTNVSEPDVFAKAEQSQKALAVISCETSAHTRLEGETPGISNNFFGCFREMSPDNALDAVV